MKLSAEMKFITDPTRLGLLVLLLIIFAISLCCDLLHGQESASVSDIQSIISAVVDKYPAHSLYKKTELQTEFASDICTVAKMHHVDPYLITAMAFYENSLNLHSQTGPGGEIGPIQVHPKTAEIYGCDTESRIGLLACGAKILREKYDLCQSWEMALAAYASKTGKCSSVYKRGPRNAALRRLKLAKKFKRMIKKSE